MQDDDLPYVVYSLIDRVMMMMMEISTRDVGVHYPGDFSSLVLYQIERLMGRYLTLLDAAKRPQVWDLMYFDG